MFHCFLSYPKFLKYRMFHYYHLNLSCLMNRLNPMNLTYLTCHLFR
jgi:hypothetical protein